MQIQILSFPITVSYSSQILALHNLIPFQNWDEKDVLSSSDAKRIYRLKWEISHVLGGSPALQRGYTDMYAGPSNDS